MPGLGRPLSPWWTHFHMVDGDFRVVQCLHCNKLVRRGKAGCSTREASNSGMAKHMKTRHADQATHFEGLLFVQFNSYRFSWELILPRRERLLWGLGCYWPSVQPCSWEVGPDLVFAWTCDHGQFWSWLGLMFLALCKYVHCFSFLSK